MTGEKLGELIATIDGYIWGPPLMILLVGTGLYLTLRFRIVQFRGFGHAWRVIKGDYDQEDDPGEITHFQALSAALSATIGTGNIVGVAAAIVLGGPGAVFWMWITALVGMATKFASCTLAVHLRRIDEKEPLTSTLCRFENRIDRKAKAKMAKVLVERFIASHDNPLERIVPDSDAADDRVHANPRFVVTNLPLSEPSSDNSSDDTESNLHTILDTIAVACRFAQASLST